MRQLCIDDLTFADIADVRALLTTGAWSREAPDRDTILHWMAVAFRTATPDLKPVVRDALGDEEWSRIQKLQDDMGPIPLRDIEVAQRALALTMQVFYETGKLRMDEQRAAAAWARWARKYAQHLCDRFGKGASESELLKELGSHDDYRQLILRFYKELSEKKPAGGER